MRRTLPWIAAAVLAVAGGARYAASAGTDVPASLPAASALGAVLDLVAEGRLDDARGALPPLRGQPLAGAVGTLIEQRAALARRLVAQARAATEAGDLQAAGRALAFALEIDHAVDAADAAAAHDARAAQAEAAIARAAACAAQRQFGCVQEAVEAARAADRHHPGAQFWSMVLADWRPAP